MNVKKIFNDICKLNLLEIFDLLTKLKNKFNFNNLSNKKAEQNLFSVVINSLGPSKIMAIKLVKEVIETDLINSKKLIDKLPCIFDKKFKKSEAIEIKERFKKIGCEVEIK